jgi:hypothetical protein
MPFSALPLALQIAFPSMILSAPSLYANNALRIGENYASEAGTDWNEF